MAGFMKPMVLFAWACLAGAAQARPNVLLICVDDLRPELKCFGAEHIHSPNIDRLAARGRGFHRHYANAPSCGPSRYTLLTGRYGPPGNDALFERAKKMGEDPGSVPPSMPEWFRRQGYTTVSVGKVSHHPGGRGGKDWDDGATAEMPGAWDRHLMPVGEWQHPRGAMHGLAHGETRKRSPDMDVFQAVEGPDTIYPDGLIVEEALKQMDALARGGKPFLLAIGIIRPHLPFGAPKKYLDLYEGVEFPPIPHPGRPEGKTTWHGSREFMQYNRWERDPRQEDAFARDVRRHYAACVSYADAQVGRIMARLAQLGLEGKTIVVVWGDHGWHLGEHSVWGKHTLFEESLRSPLIIVHPGLDKPGAPSQAVVETLDVFPTLCELAGLEVPAFVQGRSLLPQLHNPAAAGRAAIGFRANARTIRTERWRMTLHKDGHVELYDHASDQGETVNVAGGFPEVVEKLEAQLNERHG